jgi:hypothetical protein
LSVQKTLTRILLLLPFGIAGTLTILLSIAARLRIRSEHVAGLCFLFATPWAWLLDRGSFPHIENHAIQALVLYIVLLWVPATLYSVVLWLLLRAISYATTAHVRNARA